MRPRMFLWVSLVLGAAGGCGSNQDGLGALPAVDAGAAGSTGSGEGTGTGGTGGTGGSASDASAPGRGGTGGVPAPDGGTAEPRLVDASAGGSGGAPAPTGMGTWSALAPLPGGPRQEVGVAAVGGLLFVLGGQGNTTRRLEAYDPKTNKWETHEAVPAGGDHPNVAGAGGKLYLLGATGHSQTWEYDPATRKWTQKRSIPTQRAAAAAAAVGSKIYVAGGSGGGSQMLRAFEAYDTVADTWEQLPELPAPGRNHVPAAAVDGIVYVIGGRTGGPTDGLQRRVDAYDPATRTWSGKAEMPTARGGSAAGVVGSLIIVVGGEGNRMANTGVFPQAEAFDTKTNSWRRLADLKTPRHGMGAAGIDGKLYLPAGATREGGGTATDILEVISF